MQIEVRGDCVQITGYVNAVERLSKPIRTSSGGRTRTFLEKIGVGVFRRALNRNDNVKVLLNHDSSRELARTSDGSAKLEEDSIGLRADITIKDADVVEKARAGKLSGWSFGFIANDDEFSQVGKDEIRTIKDLDLAEVSILDDTRRPAYYGTLIEARGEDMKDLEIRAESFEDIKKKEEELEKEKEMLKMNALAELVAQKVVEMLTPAEAKRMEEPSAEVVPEEEEPAEDVPENEEPEEVEPEEAKPEEARAIDYSEFENRLKQLKK